MISGGFITEQGTSNTTRVGAEIRSRLTPFTRSFSPLLYFLIKELKLRQKEKPEATYTIREVCEILDVPYPNRYMSMYLRYLHQAEYLDLTLENNEYNKFRFRPSDKIQELSLINE